MTPGAGARLGPYEIVSRLGAGGMGRCIGRGTRGWDAKWRSRFWRRRWPRILRGANVSRRKRERRLRSTIPTWSRSTTSATRSMKGLPGRLLVFREISRRSVVRGWTLRLRAEESNQPSQGLSAGSLVGTPGALEFSVSDLGRRPARFRRGDPQAIARGLSPLGS